MEERKIEDRQKTQDLLNVAASRLSAGALARGLGAVAIPAFIAVIVALAILNIKTVFEPPLLLPALNTLFVSVVSFTVAYISARCYIKMGLFNVFLLGCGVLMLGAGNLIAGWLITAPGSPNVNVVIHNTGALLGSLFHAVGAMCPLQEIDAGKMSKHRKFAVVFAYLGVLLFIALVTIASLREAVPPFFIQGVGPTPLRQAVLGSAVTLFAISSFLFMRRYYKFKVDFLYWYSLALALIATGLSAVFLQKAVGSPIGWAGRSAQFLGGIYFFIAVLTVTRGARAKGISLELTLADFFREAEKHYRALIDTVSDAIISVNHENRVLLWNSAAEKMFGYSRGEAVGSFLNYLIVPDYYADSLSKDFAKAEKNWLIGKTREIEARKKNGELFPAELSVSSRKGANGRISTIIIRDITERKKAEEALKYSEERYALAQKVANIGSWDWDIPTGNLEWSEEIEPMFGFARGKFGRTYEAFLECVHPEDRQYVIDSVNACIEKGKGYDIEHRIVWPDGTVRWVSETGNVVRDENNKAIRMLGVVKDITERKHAEEILKRDKQTFERLVSERTQELFNAQAELDKTKRLSDLGTLAATVAHELRNPLGVIKTASYNIRRKRRNFLIDKHLDNIEKKISESDQIINNLLSYSQIKIPTYEKIQIYDILNECIDFIKRRFYNQNVRVVKHFGPAKKKYIDGDPLQIREVFNNILSNAYESMSNEKGKIEIMTKDAGKNLFEISITDNGTGIDEKDLDKVFQPFFTRKSKGTGLGLTICSELVRLHGGRIDVNSKKGEGTTVTITLRIKR